MSFYKNFFTSIKNVFIVYHISCDHKYLVLHLDVCADYQCSNGGTCVLNNGSPKCDCTSGFNGNHCEKKGIEETKKNRLKYYRMIIINFWYGY